MMASRKVPVWVSAEQAVWSAATTQPLFGNLDAWPRSVSSTTADQVRSTWGSPIRMSPDPHTSLAFDHDAIVAVAVAAARQAYVTGPDPFGLPSAEFTLYRLHQQHTAVLRRRTPRKDTSRLRMADQLIDTGRLRTERSANPPGSIAEPGRWHDPELPPPSDGHTGARGRCPHHGRRLGGHSAQGCAAASVTGLVAGRVMS